MYAMVLKKSGLALEWTELPHRQPGRREIPVKVFPLALKAVRKGGRVVCAGIHMSDIPSFPYQLLWEERQLVSVANLTRRDGIDFLKLAPEIGVALKPRPIGSTKPTARLQIFALGVSMGRRFLCPD
jgi:propanol-preferring alcohol dehydrogenase